MVEPAADSYVEAQVLRARCLMSAARFRAAAAAASDAARLSQERDGVLVLPLIAACAEMIARPSVEHRGAVRELAAAIPATSRPLWRAYARMIEARRIAVEVTLQARSLHGLEEVKKLLRQALSSLARRNGRRRRSMNWRCWRKSSKKGRHRARRRRHSFGRNGGKSACRRRRYRRGADRAGPREHRSRGSASTGDNDGYSRCTASFQEASELFRR